MLSFFFYLELKEAINFNYLNFYYNETEVQKAYAATAEIAVFKNGDMYGCTAFAYKRTGNEYSFITAAHCVSTTDDEKHEIIMNAEIVLLKLHDEVNVDDVHYYFGIVDAVGYETVGHDFAILSAKIYDREIPVFTLADYPLEKNQCVFNVSYPAEADGNVFFGSVTETDEDYILSKLFGIQVASGASGSFAWPKSAVPQFVHQPLRLSGTQPQEWLMDAMRRLFGKRQSRGDKQSVLLFRCQVNSNVVIP